jgi:CheY-like chemotaxis protein
MRVIDVCDRFPAFSSRSGGALKTKLRVIVADDNRAFLQKLILLLSVDFDVIAAAMDGKTALELIRLHKPNVIVLDLGMPGLNGIEIVEESANISPSPRVVICSIETDFDVVETARQAGVSAYVFKTRIEKELTLAVKKAADGNCFISPAVTLRVPGTSNWALSGTYVESCNCDLSCPRVSLTPPAAVECMALIGWQIEYGSFDESDLSGLNVAAAMYSPRNLATWKAAIYIDHSSNPAQQAALTKIFSGQLGGHPENLASRIGEVIGVRIVSIVLQGEGKRRWLQIPGVAEVEIEGVPGHGGKPITIANHPLGVAPGHPAELAKSKRLSYSDHGFRWDLSETCGIFSAFDYANW